MKTILFICTGNTCRSSMAEALARHLAAQKGWAEELQFKSAGTWAVPGASASPNAIKALAEMQVDLSGHRSQPVTEELLQEAHLILTMTRRHKEELASFCPEVQDKLYTLYEYAAEEENRDREIMDPIGQPLEVYKACAAELKDLIEKALEKFMQKTRGEKDADA